MSFIRQLARAWMLVAVAATMVLVTGAPLHAQTTSASVTGTVVDSSKGVIPGVTITLTSKSQGDVMTAVTDAEGRFVFPIVRPDTYMLKVTLEGFKTLERTNLVVNANDKLSAGMLTLEVGALTESVSVTSRVTELQTTSGERSFTMESEALTNIANNGRALFNFATLVPGVLSQNTGGAEIAQVSGFTVNGQRPNSNNMTIDGVANIDTGDNGGNMATTNIDAVAEFKILTNAYQAEYGRAVGGQLQVVTKSGTQDFHGSGYWYGRRSDWNANSWIEQARQRPRSRSRRRRATTRGYTVGGPVYIPGVFNEDKKKLFFFWSQEFQSRIDPATERQTRVPTALERRGRLLAERRQQRQSVPLHPRLHAPACPAARPTRAAASRTAACSAGFPRTGSTRPGLNALNIFPAAELQRAAAA